MDLAGCAALVTGGASGIGAAIARVIRLTTALGRVDAVRINCVCPHTVATESVLRSLESRRLEEIAPPPPTLLGVDDVVAGVRQLIEDDSLCGRVLLLFGGTNPRFLGA